MSRFKSARASTRALSTLASSHSSSSNFCFPSTYTYNSIDCSGDTSGDFVSHMSFNPPSESLDSGTCAFFRSPTRRTVSCSLLTGGPLVLTDASCLAFVFADDEFRLVSLGPLTRRSLRNHTRGSCFSRNRVPFVTLTSNTSFQPSQRVNPVVTDPVGSDLLKGRFLLRLRE